MRSTHRAWLSATFFFTTMAVALPGAAQSRNPRSTYVCITDESVANINQQFSLQGEQALNGRCMDDLPNVNRRCTENGGKGYWCNVLDTYCEVISQRDAEEDQAAAKRKQEAAARQQQYVRQLQTPMMGDDFGNYLAQQNNTQDQALKNIFGNLEDTLSSISNSGPEPTCRARQSAKAVRSQTAPARSLPAPTNDDLKKRPARHGKPSSSGTSYQNPVYYGSSDPAYVMPSPVDFSAPSPRPRTAIQNYLCRSCNEQRSDACRRKGEPNTGAVVAMHWAQICAKDCSSECGF